LPDHNRSVCTLTWHDRAAGYRVFFNRDERRERKPGLPPEVRESGGTRFIAPQDGDFGGTWIASNEHGLSVCLLNGFPAGAAAPARARTEFTTRGELPRLAIALASSAEVAAWLNAHDLTRFRPFLLVTFEVGGAGLVADWSGIALSIKCGRPVEQPLVSSSFYSEEVRRSRVAVFRDFERQSAGSAEPAMHLAFHASHRPAEGPHSPCMHRPDASTVSFSQVEVDARQVRFHYAPHSPCRGLPAGPGVRLARRVPGDPRAAP